MKARAWLVVAGVTTTIGCTGPTPMGDAGMDATAMDGSDATVTPETGAETGPGPDGGADTGPGPDGGDGGPGPTPTRITTCTGTIPAAPAGNVCAVTAGTGTGMLLRGTVLTPGEVFRGGSVAVDMAGRITCVGCDCSAMAAGATQVNCATGVISPGLINGHDHMTFVNGPPVVLPAARAGERFEHRHDWREGSGGHASVRNTGNSSTITVADMSWGELRFVMGGATSTNSSGGVRGFLRNVDDPGSGMAASASNEGLSGRRVDYDTFPLDDADGTERTSGCMYGTIKTTSVLTNRDAYTPHVAEGIETSARNEFLCLRSGMNDLVQSKSAFIHGVGLLPVDIAEMGTDGTSLIWSPRTNIFLYGDTARVTEYSRLGVNIALGTDWLESGSMNMLRELRCADGFNQNFLGRFFTDEQIWLMATRNAAMALKLDAQIGTLRSGLFADISIFNGAMHPDFRAVIDANAQDVALVLRAGTVLYGEADVVNALPGGTMCDTIDVCSTMKRACVSSQYTSGNLAALTTAAASGAGRYPLFFCGEPMNEPTCLPARTRTMAPLASVNGSTVYTGMSSADDMDGDGIASAMDNCPTVFNPIRPLDNMRQADSDMDMLGDACDPCPLNAGSTTCSIPERDSDADGRPDAMDNCPTTANPTQTDGDMDGKGDACDPCPTVANPGAAMCPGTVVTIPQIRDPASPMRPMAMSTTVYEIRDVIVTALKTSGTTSFGFAAQDRTAARFGGIYVFTGTTSPTVAVGDAVTVSGTFTNFRGMEQLTIGTTGMVMRTGTGTVPTPIVVTPAEVRTGGARAMELQSMLIRMNNVVATTALAGADFSVATSTTDTNTITVTGFLVTGSSTTAPPGFAVAMGDMFTSITGIGYAFGPAAGPFANQFAIRTVADVAR